MKECKGRRVEALERKRIDAERREREREGERKRERNEAKKRDEAAEVLLSLSKVFRYIKAPLQ